MATTIISDGKGNGPLVHTVRVAIIPKREEDLDRAKREGRKVKVAIPCGENVRTVWALPIEPYNERTEGKDVFIEHVKLQEDPDHVAVYSAPRRTHMGYEDGVRINSLYLQVDRVEPGRDWKEFCTLKDKLIEAGNW